MDIKRRNITTEKSILLAQNLKECELTLYTRNKENDEVEGEKGDLHQKKETSFLNQTR